MTAIEDLISLIFAVIRIAYGQDKSYEHTKRSSNVESLFAIHSLNVNTQYNLVTSNREEVTAQKITLTNLIIAAFQETYLDVIYSSRLRESSTARVESSSEMLTQSTRNVVVAQLNFIVKTINYKQLVSRLIVHIATISETTYDLSNKFIFELIKALQLKDSYI